MPDTLYEEDFVVWTERQAAALRELASAGSNLPLDWENLAEEIEDLGNEVRNKVRSLTRQIQLHLLKLACSPAQDQRAYWMDEVDELRTQLAQVLEGNHALRARFGEVADREMDKAIQLATRSFQRFGETTAMPQLNAWKERGISAAEVLAEDLFPEPGSMRFRRGSD